MFTTKEKINKLTNGTILSPKGFSANGIHSGVKRKRKDLGIIFSDVPATATAVYTMNVIQAAPLQVTRNSIKNSGKIQAVIVNSGNANACTGKQGLLDAYDMQKATAKQFNLNDHEVAVASTGIIGLQMPMDKIIPHINLLEPESTEKAASNFNEAILTTDTYGKSTGYQAVIDGKCVTMGGSAKGSGMIEPNMATMLAFITTDVKVEKEALDEALKEVTNKTFNCITVDGDTSTNDTALVMANGLAGNDSLSPDHKDWEIFMALLEQTCQDLAKMIARDGEGATKLVEVVVEGAKSDEEAIKVAKSVVGSSLVKTAVYGSDANWGRIIASVGYSGVEVDPQTIDMAIGPIELLENSDPVKYSEEEATKYLKNDHILISIHLNIGNGTGTAWGCDLTYDYVRINASYRS